MAIASSFSLVYIFLVNTVYTKWHVLLRSREEGLVGRSPSEPGWCARVRSGASRRSVQPHVQSDTEKLYFVTSRGALFYGRTEGKIHGTRYVLFGGAIWKDQPQRRVRLRPTSANYLRGHVRTHMRLLRPADAHRVDANGHTVDITATTQPDPAAGRLVQLPMQQAC